MTNILIYWRDYKQNWVRQFARDRGTLWHSNAKVLANLVPGDRLWMVTSGANVGSDAKQAGFLVSIWNVREVVENPGDDPAYPRDEYRYRVVADPDHIVRFDDP